MSITSNEMKQYKLLFRDVGGDVFLSSSGVGQFSYANNALGGFFTSSLITSLRQAALPDSRDGRLWETVSDYARSLTTQKMKDQKPI